MSISALHLFRTIDSVVKSSPYRTTSVNPVSKIENEPSENSDQGAYVLDPSLAAKLKQPNAENKEAEKELSPEEEEKIEELKSRDQEVRNHEQAHISAAGSYAQGGPKFEFESGPDGRRYAVAGHVNIDTSPINGEPQKTIEKARVVYSAAMAPGEPSPKDRQVASEAKKMEAEAKTELQKEKQMNPENGNSKFLRGYAVQKQPSGQNFEAIA